ncbi:unnamed protein product [Phytomonas sp. EM1]|nr:unnamed protein product [Phytomonas sp. EM1]|eukprot:CCW61306.1 unnamed protein product [Phytomonas sp. isolate EM1]
MKSILSNLSSRLKIKRKPAVAPCDCRDYFEVVESPPKVEELRSFVQSSRFKGYVDKNAVAEVQRTHGVHSLAFDLQYRCGGEGRCICADAPSCRFPICFTMRPITKGAEIQSERYAFESKETTNPAIRALVEIARQEQLEKAAEGIKRFVDTQIKQAAGGRTLSTALSIESDLSEGFIPGASRTGSGSSHSGVNPLSESEELREEVVSLYLWRAALLVNLRCDDAAVSSLLNMACGLDQKHRTRLYETAAKWAVLNDMEIIYYRALLGQYKPFPQAEFFARERPLLLHRVFECLLNDDYHTQQCANVVLLKEVIAAVSRAQATQVHGDPTEDPMKTLCLPFAMAYYRFRVGEAFWKHFFNLLCMPPLPAPEPEPGPGESGTHSTHPMLEIGRTPGYILDAVGRSMLLHHLIVFADTREREIDTGAVATRVKRLKARGEEVHPSSYDHVLNNKEMRVAVARMRELLVVANLLRGDSKERIGDGDVAGKSESLDVNEAERTRLASSAVGVDSPGATGGSLK